MGYSFTIGNAYPEIDMDELEAYIDVEEVSDAEGKALGAPLTVYEDHSNSSGGSYIWWGNFFRRHGLDHLFFAGQAGYQKSLWVGPSGEQHRGLCGSMPCCSKITMDHVRTFEAALKSYASRARPMGAHEGSKADQDLRRLEYLAFWSRWAIENCRYPAISIG